MNKILLIRRIPCIQINVFTYIYENITLALREEGELDRLRNLWLHECARHTSSWDKAHKYGISHFTGALTVVAAVAMFLLTAKFILNIYFCRNSGMYQLEM